MSDQESYQRKAFAEAVAPYGSDASRAPSTKLSISLPIELAELVKAVAAETGSSVSATIAASLRRTLEEGEQERLDAAIEAQNEENLEWANAYLPITAKLWADLEW
jgi:hypothetical protein